MKPLTQPSRVSHTLNFLIPFLTSAVLYQDSRPPRVANHCHYNSEKIGRG
ncbi:MAG: hypothetical protein RIC19_18825 [Phaeodactylibacter sp.]